MGASERDWDVVIVGAGIIGCAVAHELAGRGVRTLVLEARDAGAGATQASAGVLAPFIEAPGAGPLHALTVRSLAMYDEFVAKVSRDAQVHVEYRRCGTLEVADDAAGAARLQALGKWARSTGVEAQWIAPAEIGRLEPAVGASAGGLLVPSHGYVRASQLTGALLTAARRLGAVFQAGQPVESVRGFADHATATVGGQTHRAANLVLAAGSWSGVLDPGSAVTPVRGQLVQLRWAGAPISRVLWSDRCYIVPWQDGTVLVGATVEDAGFDERVTVGGVHQLLAAARELLPGVDAASFVAARVGLRPATPDGLPAIRRSTAHPTIVWATGHYRNGVLLAPLTARLIADLLT